MEGLAVVPRCFLGFDAHGLIIVHAQDIDSVFRDERLVLLRQVKHHVFPLQDVQELLGILAEDRGIHKRPPVEVIGNIRRLRVRRVVRVARNDVGRIDDHADLTLRQLLTKNLDRAGGAEDFAVNPAESARRLMLLRPPEAVEEAKLRNDHRLVEGEPGLDSIAVAAERLAGIAGIQINHMAAGIAVVFLIKRRRKLPVLQTQHRLDAVFDQAVDHIGVILRRLFVNDNVFIVVQEAGPIDVEAVLQNARLAEHRNILAEMAVEIRGDVRPQAEIPVLAVIFPHQVRKMLLFGTLVGLALHLPPRAGCAELKAFGKRILHPHCPPCRALSFAYHFTTSGAACPVSAENAPIRP